MTRPPTIDETIADVLRRTKSAGVVVPSSSGRADRLRKLAAALRDLPDDEPTFEDLYTVKRAFDGR